MRLASLPVVLLALAVPTAGHADPRPTTATDGFYVGARLEPGVALLGGWDLDVYLSHDRSLSVGPGVSIAVLSTQTATPGQQQDFLLAADLVRLKLGLSVAGNLRPFAALGGGFTYTRFTAQDVVAMGATMTPTLHYPAAEEFAPMATLGGGVDWFLGGPVAVSVLMLAHYHPVGSARMPDLWMDLSLGIRFGL